MSDWSRIVRLRIDLPDTKPAVWRVVEVPITTTLRALHEIIQAAMPFEDRHLYEFRAGNHRYGIPEISFDDNLSVRDAKSIRLSRFLAQGLSGFTYMYDFGDYWQHAITVEAVGDADPEVAYPRLIDGAGRAPPEDVGGTPGFEEFLKAMTRPRAREHKRMVEWYGGAFDPAAVDLTTITAKLGKLARRRTLGQAAAAKSRGGTH